MKKLKAPVGVIAASAVLTLTATSPAPDARPLIPAFTPDAVRIEMTATQHDALDTTSRPGIRYDRTVAPGEALKVTGKLPKRLAPAKVTLLRAAGTRWQKVDADRTTKRGTYALKARAAARPGTYSFAVTAKSRRGSMMKSFTVRVVNPTQNPDTGDDGNEDGTPTPPPTPVPVPTPTPTPTPTNVPPSPAGGLGDPNDWTYIAAAAPRWDPCSTITWSVSGVNAYAEHVADLTAAFATISARTGLTFTQVADPNASNFDVIWSNETENPALAGWTVGIGGPTYTSTQSGAYKIIAGRVFLDNGHSFPGGFPGTGGTWGKVMLHEIMHAVGLGHAMGQEQIMYPMMGATHLLGAGDISGLYAVGAAKGCFAPTASHSTGKTFTDIQK